MLLRGIAFRERGRTIENNTLRHLSLIREEQPPLAKQLVAQKIGIVWCIAVLLGGVSARAAELNGAWTNDLSACDKIFVKKNKTISLASNSDIYGSGFIIDGSRIRGKIATCVIKLRKDEGGLIHLITGCSTDVALSTVQFSLKMDGDNKLTRIFPGVPELSMSYVRCPF